MASSEEAVILGQELKMSSGIPSSPSKGTGAGMSEFFGHTRTVLLLNRIHYTKGVDRD